MADNKLRVAILGASGYTGAELVRLLSRHPHVEICALTADRQAGKPVAEVFPHLGARRPADADQDRRGRLERASTSCSAACRTAPTQEVIAALPRAPQDRRPLGRLPPARHRRPMPTGTATSTTRPSCRRRRSTASPSSTATPCASARLVANPGCYPTAAQLPLVPLLEAGLIDADDIIIDAKSGVSGAGRDAKQASLYAEVAEGIHAYGVASHRHAPEIEQGLTRGGGRGDRRQLHAASDADEPRHPRHDLCAAGDGRDGATTCARPLQRALRRRALRPRAAGRRRAGDAPRARHAISA